MSARRDPYHAFVFDESLFAFMYETPLFELALLPERNPTRAVRLGKSAVLSLCGARRPRPACNDIIFYVHTDKCKV